MKWINNQEIVFMEMDRLQKKWQFIHTNIKKIKLSRGLSESDMSGWVELHRNYFFLKNEDVLWLSAKLCLLLELGTTFQKKHERKWSETER